MRKHHLDLCGGSSSRLSILINFSDIFNNVSINSVVRSRVIGRNFNSCNAIDNQNRMRQSGLSLEKYLLTQSGYVSLVTTVAFVMGTTYGNISFCCGIS